MRLVINTLIYLSKVTHKSCRMTLLLYTILKIFLKNLKTENNTIAVWKYRCSKMKFLTFN